MRRQIGVEKTKCVRGLDYANTGGALLLHNQVAKLLHPGPVHFRPEMMLGVVAVIKPGPVVELVVAAHAPGEGFIRVSAVVAIIPVQIREAMAEVIKRNQETDVVPVEDSEHNERAHEQDKFGDSPERFPRVPAFQFFEDCLGIFPEEVEEGVFKRMLGLPFVTMLVERNPIDGFAMGVRPVGVALVMLHMDACVKHLAEPDGDGFQDAEQAVEQGPPEAGGYG